MKKILLVATVSEFIYSFLFPHISMLKQNGYIVDVLCSKDNFSNYLDNNPEINKCIYVEFSRSMFSKNNLKAFKSCKEILKHSNYDIIYTHTPIASAIIRFCARKYTKIKKIYFAHGFHFFKGNSFLKNLIFENLEKSLSKYTDTIITLNQEDYENALKFNTCNVIKVNGAGLDLKKLYIDKSKNYLKNKFNLHEKDTIILSVGELNDNKNHISIINALYKLNNTNLHYFIAGSGDNYNLLLNRIKEFNLESNIHLLGFCDNVNELYSSSDIFCLPSFREGLSFALMEAMQYKNAIIASNIRGNIDLIDNDGGILVDPHNIDEIVSAINKLINNSKLCMEMGNYNHEKVQKYNLENVLKKIRPLF